MASNPEIRSIKQRRSFTSEEKARILAEYEAAATPPERAALIRREGLYSSLLANWRGQLAKKAPPRKRGRPGNPLAADNARLRKENERLEPALSKSRKNHRRAGKSARALADDRRRERNGPRAVEVVVNALAQSVGERTACVLLGWPRATLQRHRNPPVEAASSTPCRKARHTPRRLSDVERRAIFDHAHSGRFCDRSVRQICATLLDEGVYVASISTWYRVLRAAGETRERRHQATHPATVKPELATTQPGQVWSWDITKLRGPVKWTYYYLYVVLDIFSRYVVAWRLEYRESATLTGEMIEEAIMREGVDPRQLTIHADRGTSMTSKTVAQLYSDLGVTKSFSRPHVSDDNPFSEAQFKTLKYGPHFPSHFANIEHGRAHCRRFFPWYNDEHHHSGIALLTPADVHLGRAQTRTDARREVLRAAWEAHPERFVRGVPQPPAIALATFINPPEAA